MAWIRALCTAAAVFAALAALAVPGRAHAADPAVDFTAEVKQIYRVAACGAGELPAGFDAKTVDAHCKPLKAAVDHWHSKWFKIAQPFFAELLKGGYPSQAVYPFGGGDLLSFLAVYPDATEYTTLSLEGMGDPRPIAKLRQNDGADAKAQKASTKKLGARLATVRTVCVAQLKWAWNTTIQLSIDSNKRGDDVLPGVLVMTLIAFSAHGYEPVAARYFTVAADGSLVYLTAADVAAFDANPDADAAQRKKKAGNENLVQVGPFNNIEIVFQKIGDASAPKKTFRHIAADLSDGGLKATPGPILHLKQKKEVAAMTKAASYLLWMKSFSQIRDYLLAHMKLMLSDDTGIPPRYAKPAGFKQDTWGKFEGAYFGNGGGADVVRELKDLWKKNPQRKLPFRFGYYDNAKNVHLLFTYK